MSTGILPPWLNLLLVIACFNSKSFSFSFVVSYSKRHVCLRIHTQLLIVRIKILHPLSLNIDRWQDSKAKIDMDRVGP